MASPQNITVEDLLNTLGLTGYNGVAAAVDGTTNTQLNITVTQPAYAIFVDGVVLKSELVTTHISGLSTNGSYHLYLDYQESYEARTPVWTVAASAPTSNAILVADVTVATGHLTTVTMATAGLNGNALTALNITKVA
jgi:hypothetical protein